MTDAPPPYTVSDGDVGCSQDCQPPAYPSLAPRARGDPILLSVTHLSDPQDVNIDYNCQQNQESAKPISSQPKGMPTPSDNCEEEPESCCDCLKFWGCFTCLVFCWCLGNIR